MTVQTPPTGPEKLNALGNVLGGCGCLIMLIPILVAIIVGMIILVSVLFTH